MMTLQDHIDETALDTTEIQVKAFMLGFLCAENPLPFPKVLEEILSETPEARDQLEAPLQKTWNDLKENQRSELDKIFPFEETDLNTFIEISKDQLDYFLTGMSLSGTNLEKCADSTLRDFIDELEDTVEDMDDYLSDSEASKDDGEDLKEFLFDTWKDFIESRY